MNLEADQAVQEARFAGACQDQHAGRPAPNLGWPGERKSIVQQAETSVVSRNETNQGYGAWGFGAQGLGPGPPGLQQSQCCRGGGGLEGSGHGIPPLPPPHPPPPPPCKGEKKMVFSSPLLKPSNTPPKVGGFPSNKDPCPLIISEILAAAHTRDM